jgi:hypothetical protein
LFPVGPSRSGSGPVAIGSRAIVVRARCHFVFEALAGDAAVPTPASQREWLDACSTGRPWPRGRRRRRHLFAARGDSHTGRLINAMVRGMWNAPSLAGDARSRTASRVRWRRHPRSPPAARWPRAPDEPQRPVDRERAGVLLLELRRPLVGHERVRGRGGLQGGPGHAAAHHRQAGKARHRQPALRLEKPACLLWRGRSAGARKR